MANVQKNFAIGLGVVLVLIGILGLFSDMVLGLFSVNALHTWVHIIAGAVLLWAGLANNGANARNTNITFGFIYLIVAVLGFLGMADWLAVNGADNLLHVLIAAAALGVGYGVKE